MDQFYVTINDSEANLVHGIVEANSHEAAARDALLSWLDDNEETIDDYESDSLTVRTWLHESGTRFGFSGDPQDFNASDLVTE